LEAPITQHPGRLVAESPVPAAEAAALTASSVEAARPGRRLRPFLYAAVGLVALAAGASYGRDYWTVGRFLVSTDDAYVQADNTTVAPKVSGYIATVLVGDNEPVKAGQKLAEIDDRDFRVALESAKADVAAAQAALLSKRAALQAQDSVIASAMATLDVDRANLAFAGDEDKRYSTLAASGYGTVKNAQAASANIAANRATLARDTAAAEGARRQIDVLKAESAQAASLLARAEAAERQAELNLSYTTIVAPVDGVVGARTLRVGQYVQAGTQLMAVVPAASAYIVANYKETQLTDVRAGQKADVEIDTYPGRVFHGHVDSLAPASGQEFALLPPDNATGNFTKVVQRIPVKILLDGEASADVLRPGMSVTPTIDTRANARAVAARN
jgi:membrane fusion protein (multidrug efflux system)